MSYLRNDWMRDNEIALFRGNLTVANGSKKEHFSKRCMIALHAYTASFLDWQSVLDQRSLKTTKRDLSRDSDNSVKYLIQMLFSMKNTRTLSWRTK